jgi:hypothetical protein
MRGTKAKRLRALAREATKHIKPTTGVLANRQLAYAGWAWLTGYRRVYQDSKRRAS